VTEITLIFIYYTEREVSSIPSPKNITNLTDYHGMRIYSGEPQDTGSNSCPLARIRAVDFFLVPLAAQRAEARMSDRLSAPARAGRGTRPTSRSGDLNEPANKNTRAAEKIKRPLLLVILDDLSLRRP
jgi:hypothetical protein